MNKKSLSVGKSHEQEDWRVSQLVSHMNKKSLSVGESVAAIEYLSYTRTSLYSMNYVVLLFDG